MENDAQESALQTFLPAIVDPTDPPWVLDVGGGPKCWAFWLAEHGYATTRIELSPALVDIARKRMAELPFAVQNRIEQIAVGDARDLSRWSDASFDAVLALGLFDRLPDPDDLERGTFARHGPPR